MTQIRMYGIPNCNTVKKALDYLRGQNLGFVLHNFKTAGLTAAKLQAWEQQLGAEKLLNRKGTTWRTLTPEEQALAATGAGALTLMLQYTSLIRRPVVEWPGGSITAGFDAAVYDQAIRG